MSQASAVSRPPASAQPLTAADDRLRNAVHAAGEAVEPELDDLAEPRGVASSMIGGM